MKRIIYIFMILTASTFAGLTQAAEMPDFPFISVTGVAEIEVAPDTVTLEFSVLEFQSESESAMTQVRQQSEAVLNLLKKYKVPKDNIESYGIDKQVRRNYEDRNGPLEILGYEISQRFTVKINQLSSYDPIVSQLMGMQNITGISANFDVSNRDEILQDLSQKAGGDARKRAVALARGLDVKIKSVHAISQGQGLSNFMPSYTLHEKAYASGMRSAPSLFIPTTISLSQNVNVIFSITP